MKKMSDSKPLHFMKLDKYTLRMERNELGITLVDENGDTLGWLNAIGTAILKEWLKDFDPKGKWLSHQSVKKGLEERNNDYTY